MFTWYNKGNKVVEVSMTIKLEDGKYAVTVQALKKEADEPSAMEPYLGEVAIVTVAGGRTYLTFMLREQNIITNFQLLHGDHPIERMNSQVNEELNNRYEIFELEELKATVIARVQYELTHEGREIKGDEQLRLVLDEESIQDLEGIKE